MRALAFLTVLFAASRALAANPYLPAAERLHESLEYEAALDQLQRARAFPGTTPQELVQIEALTGVIKFELGDAEAGRLAFRTALALDPNAELPKGTSPKIRTEWNAIKKEIKKLKVETPKPQVTQPAPQPPVLIPVPTPVPQTQPNLAPEPAPGPSQLEQSLQPNASEEKTNAPYFVLGGAGALAAGGVVFGVLSKSASSSAVSEPVQVKAGAQDDTAHSRALVANVLYGAATVAAVAGVVWLVER